MTRKGAGQRPWTADELARLAGMAGRLPAARIADALGRSRWAVVKAAKRQGLALRCPVSRLAWCSGCASWRSAVGERDGLCRVCRMERRLAEREAACAAERAAMTTKQRAAYDAAEAKRGTRPSSLGPRPRPREGRAARAGYLLALEAWEYRRLKLPYDAAKTRLMRMREARGANPRKGPKRS